jgi:hypothetical protein
VFTICKIYLKKAACLSKKGIITDTNRTPAGASLVKCPVLPPAVCLYASLLCVCLAQHTWCREGFPGTDPTTHWLAREQVHRSHTAAWPEVERQEVRILLTTCVRAAAEPNTTKLWPTEMNIAKAWVPTPGLAALYEYYDGWEINLSLGSNSEYFP